MERVSRLLASMKERRGYLLPFHVLLAEHDPEFLESYNALLEAAFLDPRALDRRTKELVLIGILTAISAPASHIEAHMRAALAAGASSKEVLEGLELVMPSAGAARFMEGLEVWHKVVQAEAPTSEVLEADPSS